MIVASDTSPLTSLAAISRHAATRLGFRPLGVLGTLLQAKRLGALTEIRPLLDALREQAGFFLSERLYRQVLEQAGERA